MKKISVGLRVDFWLSLAVLAAFAFGCKSDSVETRLPSEIDSGLVATVQGSTQENVKKADSSAASKVEQSYSWHRGNVQRNDSYYEILNRLNVSPKRIYSLTTGNQELLDRYQLKPGQRYRYQVSTDSAKYLKKLVWMPTRRDKVIFHFGDSLFVTAKRKPLNKKITSTTGVIESSLYETFMDKDLPIQLAYKLSELYAWQIDFFLLREGDAFKVIYEQNFVEGEQVGIGKILAAEFRHRDQSYKAYRFFNGNEIGYYNPDGESLQKALLKAPLKFRYISSGFSHSRYHPILHRRMPHYGIDYVAPRGTPVVSVGDGTVLTADYKGPNGNMVKIRHNSTYTTTYIHLSDYADNIYAGAEVEQGEVIGYVGSTGRSTGSHLDYRLYKNGQPVNPRTINLPPTDGIDEAYMPAFRYASDQLGDQMRAMNFNEEKDIKVTHSPDASSDEDDAEKSS
jgi:murein DD-endopeptidase MepM/ murein hydrolase activator NlpD